MSLRENKRKRSPARAPSEEGELAGPANDDDLDYLRAKKKKTDGDNIMTRTGKNRENREGGYRW